MIFQLYQFYALCYSFIYFFFSDSRDESRFTPLHLAAMLRNIKMIGLLLDFGAEIDARAFNNDTPTDMASNSHFYDVVTYLMEKGAVCHAHFMG